MGARSLVSCAMDVMDANVTVPRDLGLGFPFWVTARRRFTPDDPFFAAGNTERELLAKHVNLFIFSSRSTSLISHRQS